MLVDYGIFLHGMREPHSLKTLEFWDCGKTEQKDKK